MIVRGKKITLRDDLDMKKDMRDLKKVELIMKMNLLYHL